MPDKSYERLVALLLAILVLELVARQLRLPPAAAFICGGLVLALVPGVPIISVDPRRRKFPTVAFVVPARSEIGIMNPDLPP